MKASKNFKHFEFNFYLIDRGPALKSAQDEENLFDHMRSELQKIGVTMLNTGAMIQSITFFVAVDRKRDLRKLDQKMREIILAFLQDKEKDLPKLPVLIPSAFEFDCEMTRNFHRVDKEFIPQYMQYLDDQLDEHRSEGVYETISEQMANSLTITPVANREDARAYFKLLEEQGGEVHGEIGEGSESDGPLHHVSFKLPTLPKSWGRPRGR